MPVVGRIDRHPCQLVSPVMERYTLVCVCDVDNSLSDGMRSAQGCRANVELIVNGYASRPVENGDGLAIGTVLTARR